MSRTERDTPNPNQGVSKTAYLGVVLYTPDMSFRQQESERRKNKNITLIFLFIYEPTASDIGSEISGKRPRHYLEKK